jgi:uncharacterized protein YjbI with pentapeptide repeats
LSQADFTGARLPRADLSSACLTEARFARAVLNDADFWFTEGVRPDFTGADLRGARSLHLALFRFPNTERVRGTRERKVIERATGLPNTECERRALRPLPPDRASRPAWSRLDRGPVFR